MDNLKLKEDIEHTSESIKKMIDDLHNAYPPERRTEKVKKLLEKLYKAEQELLLKDLPDLDIV